MNAGRELTEGEEQVLAGLEKPKHIDCDCSDCLPWTY